MSKFDGTGFYGYTTSSKPLVHVDGVKYLLPLDKLLEPKFPQQVNLYFQFCRLGFENYGLPGSKIINLET